MNEQMRSALEEFIRRESGADGVSITEAKLLSGGSIQENWFIDTAIAGGVFGPRLQLVVRTDAPSGVAGSLCRAEEFALLKAAYDAGVTVPEPLWLCRDAGLIGKQFFVMRFIQGVAASHLVVRDMKLGGDRRLLLERLGSELGRIHSIRPPRADLAFLPPAEASPRAAERRAPAPLPGHPSHATSRAGVGAALARDQCTGTQRDRAVPSGLPYRQLHGR